MKTHQMFQFLSLALLATSIFEINNTALAASCSATCQTGYTYSSGTCEFTSSDQTTNCGGNIICVKMVWENGKWEQKGTDSVQCVGSATLPGNVSRTHAKAYCQDDCPMGYEHSSGTCTESVSSAPTGEFKCTESSPIMCSKQIPGTGPTTGVGSGGGSAKDPLGPPFSGGSSGTPPQTLVEPGGCDWFTYKG